jgi:hypothetical protein
MKTEEKERMFQETVRRCLNEGIEKLDGQTLLRLRSIRLQAMEASRGKKGFFPVRRWITAGGFATVSVLIVAVSIWSIAYRQPVPGKHGEDVEILSAREHLELYEDLDFYRWLAAEKGN